MSRRFSLVAVLVAVAALAAAGCGSSSKSKTTQPPPATTPPTPQTPSTGTGTSTTGSTTPSSLIPSHLSSSTPIDSPALREALVKKLATVSAIPSKDDGPIADCVIKKLKSQGIQTYGDANKHLSSVRDSAAACTKQVLTGG
jgi:ABC-type oligopeptide transport system substrate-binding subunit